jgi:uncharacterized protein involved in exopolysaccharide biosynthesis
LTLREIFNTILFYKNPILKITLFSTILIFLILFFVYPISYKAPVTILPPAQDNKFGSFGGLIGGQDFSSLITGGLTNANSQLFMEMLKSRSAAEYVVKKLNLIDYFDSKNEYEAAGKLLENLELSLNKEGIITLTVETKTSFLPVFFANIDSVKKFSAKLSNTFVEALDKINREKLTSKAKKAREYIEEQIKFTKAKLDSAENELMIFQNKNKTVSLPEQISAAIDAAAKLKTEIVNTEVQIGLLESNLREDNKTIIALKKKLEQLKEQYNKMELGNQDYLLAFKEVPELGKKLAAILREVKIQNEVYLLLQQQYYKEKIQENRDLPTVDVLDEAIPPLKASGPRVIFSSVLGGVFIFLLLSIYFVLKDKQIIQLKKKVRGN